MENLYTRTVAAVSTPPGKGGIAVIRISGEDAGDILCRVFVPGGKANGNLDCGISDTGSQNSAESSAKMPKNALSESNASFPTDRPRRAIFGSIIGADGEVIDTGIAVFYASPASFTGENVAEISCHGGILVTKRVLESVFAAGAYPAGPGEFTRRAFISGKMTLSEAEAVGLLLDAGTDSQMKLASSGARGLLSERISGIADRVSGLLSSLYAVIDYPDEDLEESAVSETAAMFLDAANDAEALSATFRTGRAIANGVRTLICGKPNAGKSSLYNALIGDSRAIVTDVPGTTRDVLEDTVDAGGVTLRLWDTAGIRDSMDEVEKIGVGLALSRMDEAELIFAVYDGSSELDDGDVRLMDEIRGRCAGRDVYTVAVVNKSDAGFVLTASDMDMLRSHHNSVARVSAKNGDGIDELCRMVGDLYGLGEIKLGSDAVVWDAVRRAELDSAAELLKDAASALVRGEPEDAVCSVAEGALAALRRTDGRGVSEEIVDGIFSRFCVGK